MFLKNNDYSGSSSEPEHAVIINFKYGKKTLIELYWCERRLKWNIWRKRVGEYDGHEIAVDLSNGTLYMYGPDAEKLFSGIKRVLEKTSFMKGAIVTLRFGPPKESTISKTVEI